MERAVSTDKTCWHRFYKAKRLSQTSKSPKNGNHLEQEWQITTTKALQDVITQCYRMSVEPGPQGECITGSKKGLAIGMCAHPALDHDIICKFAWMTIASHLELRDPSSWNWLTLNGNFELPYHNSAYGLSGSMDFPVAEISAATCRVYG